MNEDDAKQIEDGIVVAQAMAFMCREILFDMVADLAGADPDPRKRLAAMFERISARMDARPLKLEEKAGVAFQRERTAAFFSLVEREVIARRPRPGA